MTDLIRVFALLICMAGIIILINPAYIWSLFERNIKRTETQVLAVLVRLLIGVLLLIQCDLSRYPTTIQFLGLLSVATALVLAAMGRANFVKLMSWAVANLKPFARVGGVLALVFGGFIVYAFR